MANHVLVVGADDTVTNFLVDLLRHHDIAAEPANATNAASRVNDDEPSLVIVDTYLAPVRSIRALADPKKAAVPILVLGAEKPSVAAQDEATDAGASHFVARPVTDTGLVRGIKSILGTDRWRRR